jgi:hypothetical protein
VRRVFYHGRSGCAACRIAAGLACKIFDTCAPQKSWCGGTELARMPSVACRSYPPIWATSMSVTRSGTLCGAAVAHPTVATPSVKSMSLHVPPGGSPMGAGLCRDLQEICAVKLGTNRNYAT